MSQQLHDRATRGEALTTAERAELDAWYAQNDREEASEISIPGAQEFANDLRCQLDANLAELAKTTQRVRQITTGNDAIRQENDRLRRQLAAITTPHAV